MSSIGEFGTVREKSDDVPTFGLVGQTFRVAPNLSDLAIMDIVETTLAAENMSGVQALAATKALLQSLVHPDDFDAMWAHARATAQTIDDITGLAQAIIASVTDRPTRQPSDSSDGPQETGPSSEVVSFLPAKERLEAKGRGDLAQFVDLAHSG